MGTYSGFDIEHKESSINNSLLSAYVDVAGHDPDPEQQTISPQPASDFKLLPDDVPTPFDESETAAAPAVPAADAPAPAAVEETAAVEDAAASNETAIKDAGKDQSQDEAAKKKAHEEAEAKRKAEFDARQAEKKAAEQAQLDKIAAMSEDELMSASMQRVSTDTEKLTRRNMKECVSEHIQTLCLDDPAFARMVMHPRKSMVRCFQFISQKAWDYIQDELKANGIKPGPGQQGYGADVPDDLCYQWAEDYFRDPNAKIDHEDDEEFTPRPYYGGQTKSNRTPKGKKQDKKTAEKKAPEKKTTEKPKEESDQLSLMEVA